MIEGDFLIPEKIVEVLNNVQVKVECNPSGYTRIHFSPEKPNLRKIEMKWNKIVSLLPLKSEPAGISMTRRARQFRIKYC